MDREASESDALLGHPSSSSSSKPKSKTNRHVTVAPSGSSIQSPDASAHSGSNGPSAPFSTASLESIPVLAAPPLSLSQASFVSASSFRGASAPPPTCYGATPALPRLSSRLIPPTFVPDQPLGLQRTQSFPDDLYSGVRFSRFELEEQLRRRHGTSILDWLHAQRQHLQQPTDAEGDASERERDRIKQLKAQHLESFDYDFFESRVHLQHDHEQTEETVRALNLGRWVMTFLIGMCTALVACFIDDLSRKLGRFRTASMQRWVTRERDGQAPIGHGFLVYAATSVAYIAVAAYCVAILCPVAGGSGISEIKATLNGIKIHRIVRLKTLFCKAFGILFSVAGGLPVGKEGPMIHTGAVVGAGLSQGKSSSCGLDTSWTKFKGFRNDKEKRDFISCGAAAGVAAAFGAPIGGVLFALEEGASFWHQNLTWRTFFCAMVSAFVINCFASFTENRDLPDGDSSKHGFLGVLGTQTGTFSFGNFDGTKSYEVLDLVFFIAIGMLGGLFGAGFNQANKRLTLWRMRMNMSKWAKLFEALFVAFCMAAVSFWLPRYFGKCQKIDGPYSKSLIPLYCPDGEYNDMASLFTVSYSTSIKQLLHFTTDTSFSPMSLGIFFSMFYIIACWTYGLSVPSGLFIPSLLSGAAFGRIFILIVHWFDLPVGAPDGMFALIGAASMLGGMARMTISLTVIILECTGVIEWGLPIMVALMSARWVGNSFNEGLYDIHIHLKHLPFLEYDPPFYARYLRAENIMAKPVVTVKQIAKVGEVYDILLNCNHGGFPVVIPPRSSEDDTESDEKTERKPLRFAGIINRRHLCILLQRKDFFVDKPAPYTRKPASDTTLLYNDQYALSYRDLESNYPRFPSIYDIKLDDDERDLWMDLTPYMNPTPNTVQDQTPVPHAFRVFRSLGMRHLIVLNRRNEVKGVITRKDLTPTHLKHCLEALSDTEKQRIRGYFMRGRSMSQHFDDVERTLLSIVDNS